LLSIRARARAVRSGTACSKVSPARATRPIQRQTDALPPPGNQLAVVQRGRGRLGRQRQARGPFGFGDRDERRPVLRFTVLRAEYRWAFGRRAPRVADRFANEPPPGLLSSA